MDLSNQQQAETFVRAEMDELSLEYLASVSGGGPDGGTPPPTVTCPPGNQAEVIRGRDSNNNVTVTVICHKN
jgi:hypothetical protein